jgi:hypothetical protein
MPGGADWAVEPFDPEPGDAEKRELVALILAGLGEAEIKIVASYATPFFWTSRVDGGEIIKGGTAFLLDTGKRIFAVTACHVVEECFADTRSRQFIQCMIGGKFGPTIPFFLGDRIIDAHHDIDIATFWLTEAEIQRAGIEVLRGFYYPRWPPPLAQLDRGVTYCGYPGNGRRKLTAREISFGVVSMAGIASSINETSLSILIERENLFQVLGNNAMPSDYDFGGISGGPVLAIVDTGTIRSWMPAGVIFQGPNPTGVAGQSIVGLEIIKARPVHFIKPDGLLDVERWEQTNFLYL